jgi:hypothetical protein
LASSQPATSAKVTVLADSSSMRALLLPKEKAPPLPPPCIWRMKKIHTPISSSIGNQETKMFMRKDCSSSGLATTLTPFLSRSLTIHRSGRTWRALNWLNTVISTITTPMTIQIARFLKRLFGGKPRIRRPERP